MKKIHQDEICFTKQRDSVLNFQGSFLSCLVISGLHMIDLLLSSMLNWRKGELFLEDQITGWNSIISEKSQVQESCNHENADEDGLLPMAQMMRTENEDRVVAVQW